MSDLLISLAIGIGFVLGTIALVLGSYFIARTLLHPGYEGDRTWDVANNVAVRIATLHGLILGLVYAQELDDYKGVRATLTDEAIAISDVYHDAGRYGGVIVVPLQEGLARYLAVVVDEEWPLLAQHQGLSPKAWMIWDEVYRRLLDLSPTTDRERYLSQRMKDRIASIARYRQLREATSVSRFSGLFWGAGLDRPGSGFGCLLRLPSDADAYSAAVAVRRLLGRHSLLHLRVCEPLCQSGKTGAAAF
ncbi:hypothetical protein [Rhizobium sp. LCM 4573]|uniref:bestrophin-like domain n=1 Tax=Rhizobium sp. LCM 4573 TaxID=1848291 RepID=UPI000A61D6B3|nr:hypothetical protein [Rhizobium sp. LCM 4573]